MSKNLTNRQLELLSFLRVYSREHKLMPTTREIQEHFGFASQTAAMGHLRALERKGLIIRHPNKARAVILAEFAEQTSELPSIPIYENVVPSPLKHDSSKKATGSLAIDITSLGKLQSNSTFAFRVADDNMSNASICKGDLLICEPSIPNNNDIVLVKIGDKTIIKRFVHMLSSTFLVEENPNPAEPFPSMDVVIQGVVVTLVRNI